jgi:hemolysin III
VDAIKAQTGAPTHYFTSGERLADQWVHLIGLGCGVAGGALLVSLAAVAGGLGRTSAVLVYTLCLVTMLAASAAYNLARGAQLQRRLRRLDHAAIFLMIAGSYTPFTTQRLEGAWAFVMTIAVWAIALVAAAGKLFLSGISKRVWIPIYVLLGWMVLGAIKPLAAGVRPAALILLVIGGVIYTLGVIVYAVRTLPYRRAIWHGFVLTAACTHYAAILTGVVLV